MCPSLAFIHFVPSNYGTSKKCARVPDTWRAVEAPTHNLWVSVLSSPCSSKWGIRFQLISALIRLQGVKCSGLSLNWLIDTSERGMLGQCAVCPAHGVARNDLRLRRCNLTLTVKGMALDDSVHKWHEDLLLTVRRVWTFYRVSICLVMRPLVLVWRNVRCSRTLIYVSAKSLNFRDQV